MRARRSWSPSPNIRQWPADYPVASYGDDPISVFIYNAVGGSTIGYAGNFWRFTPSDFRVRSLDGVGVDWPIGYDDLAPFYTINEREMGVAGLAGDPWSPPREPLPLPPAPLGPHGRLMIAGLREAGLGVVADRAGDHDAAVRRAPGLRLQGLLPVRLPARRAGHGRRHLLAQGAALRAATASTCAPMPGSGRSRLHPDGRAKGALYYDADGRLREVRAKVVVLAAGGLGTPRLLLHSTSAQHPDGLANSSGLVGKNLMVHVQTFVIGRFDEPVQAWQGTWGGAVSTRQFYETDPANDYLRGFVMSINPGWSPLNLALQVAPWGEEHHAAMDRHLNHEVVLFCCGEDLPEERNRVELDWDNLDAFGLPGAKTFYAFDDNSKKLGAAMIRRGTELMAGSGRQRRARLRHLAGAGLASDGHGAHGERPGRLRR